MEILCPLLHHGNQWLEAPARMLRTGLALRLRILWSLIIGERPPLIKVCCSYHQLYTWFCLITRDLHPKLILKVDTEIKCREALLHQYKLGPDDEIPCLFD